MLADVGARHPQRFAITTASRILDLPDTVWINQPADGTTQEADTTGALNTPAGLIRLEKFRTGFR
ncbi:hypothetical protein ACFZC5_36285 [Nocardia gamkensis]|uniref:hypothetical protein n=1 Tax=Nocardia gamkensis TaxID=352869 RepID=UPI0036E79399